MNARASLGEACDLERQNKAHGVIGQQRSGARSVREHEIDLQLGEVLARDFRLRQFSESGVDPVSRFARGDDPFYGFDRGLEFRDACRIERNWRSFARDAAQDCEPERNMANGNGTHCAHH